MCPYSHFVPPLQCDEGDPCRNCIKRKESCVRVSPEPSGRRTSEPESPTSLTLPPPGMACHSAAAEPVNLLHMELLHHFERYSIPTLPFQGVWPRMLQLAFQVRTTTAWRRGEMEGGRDRKTDATNRDGGRETFLGRRVATHRHDQHPFLPSYPEP